MREYSAIPEFYVYALLDPRKPGVFRYGKWKFDYEPFYVGKGKSDRFTKHKSEDRSNPHKARKIAKIKAKGLDVIIVLKRRYLTEQEALDLEVALIKRIGRALVGGPLTNLTDGGEGLSGYKAPKHKLKNYSRPGSRNGMHGQKHSDEAINKMRINRKGLTAKTNNPMYGRTHSAEAIAKMRQNRKGKGSQPGEANGMYGRTHTRKARKQMSISRKGRKQPEGSGLRKALNNPRTKPVIVKGKTYYSMNEAIRQTGISEYMLNKGLASGLYKYG